MSTRVYHLGNKVLEPFFREMRLPLPDRNVMSIDDEQVKSIALELGIPLRVRTGRGDGAGPHFNAIFRQTATHWLIFAEWFGHEKSADNGYGLVGWAKSKCSPESAIISAGEFMRFNVDGEVNVTELNFQKD